jgi:hypothetical protein
VFYDPDGNGPYEDGQAALEEVPPGGTFVIGHGTWDVAEEGRLFIDRSINVRGMGWVTTPEYRTYGSSGSPAGMGTWIVNTGEDAIDEPVVEFNGPDDLEHDNPRITGSLREVAIEHQGDSPAVRVRRTIRSYIADCLIDCMNTAPKGIRYETWSFFARTARNSVVGATEICVDEASSGYAHEFHSNHIATGVDEAIAFQTSRHRTLLTGGECAATGEDGIAIRFVGPLQGGYVVEPGIEHTAVGISLGGEAAKGPPSGSVQDVQLYHIGLARGVRVGAGEVGVRFGNAQGCRLIRPVTYPWRDPNYDETFDLVRWSEDSEDCGVTGPAWCLADQRYVDDGAKSPYVHVSSNVDAEMLSRLPTGVPTTVDYYEEAGRPVVHDGSSWKRPAPYQSFAPDTTP